MSLDAVQTQIYRHLLASIPEEMGAVLMRSAFSPNIKERLDFSCAITDGSGALAAQASHIPVHLGSVHVTGAAILREVALRPGDVVLLNDPYRGGTHLPDVTAFAPVFVPGQKGPVFGVMCRAHHADVGGGWPGSMGPAKDLYGEGLVIPPVRWVREGVEDPDILNLVLANTRTPKERGGDLRAQRSAVERGRDRLQELIATHGMSDLAAAVKALRQHAAKMTCGMLRELPNGVFRAEGALDGPGTPVIRVTVTKQGESLVVDFTGTDPEVPAPFNANEAITLSAIFYVVRLLVSKEVPTNAGCLDPVRVVLPPGTLVSARRPAAVAAGNVETSQRLVDVLLSALGTAAPDRVPAGSQGTMNNLTAGGVARDGTPFTFYETLGGGAGAGPHRAGASGLQTHMTNTLNTPVEALEVAYPFRVGQYRLRRGSGGVGQRNGGEGLIRELEVLVPTQVTVTATRRKVGAAGLDHGGSGQPGRDRVRQGGRWRPFPASGSVELQPGDAVRIETPGGGGHGRPLKISRKRR